MLKSKLLVSVLALAGVMFSAAASAQVYVGGTVGTTKWNDSCVGAVKCDTTGNSYKLLGGYTLDKNFAIEASYFSLGKMSATATVAGKTVTPEVKGTGFSIAGVFSQDFSDDGKFGGFAKLGIARVKTDVNAAIPGIASYSSDTTSTQPVFGLGLTYKVSKEVALRAEFEQTRAKLGTEKDNVRSFNIGATYAF